MSTFIFTENGVMSFNDFLNESFQPVSVKYGTNAEMNNKKTKIFYDVLESTFFEYDSKYYCVSILDNEVGFGVSLEKETDPSFYTDGRLVTANALRVFNQVIYILLEITKNKKEVVFSGANDALARVYDRMIKNKSFLKIMRDAGFKYNGVKDSKHHFSK